MGSNDEREDECPQHRVYLPAYWIARVLITNHQYHKFTQKTGHPVPSNWENGHPRKDLESHPVVYVTWHDAQAYCQWLSKMTSKTIRLPSEAEWEKAARGDKDARVYPWGNAFDRLRCNTEELGLKATTPVGIFPDGVSPYKALDMSGNVLEWTYSLWGEDFMKPSFSYPYIRHDGREDLDASDNVLRVVRGGSYMGSSFWSRCAFRRWYNPYFEGGNLGFRVAFSPSGSEF